ncbi:MAG: Methionine aminopeptidase [uncultured bacterium]|nr:MAG: Methionine aminopeptidase [uncultured bacterium]HBY73221.1 type I methionyl aminopeptidase [Candidatus Kerfeldbacteria bacterium]
MIHIHTPKEQAGLRASGQVLAQVMNALIAAVRPGVTLLQLERVAADTIQQAGAQPAFVGYHGYKNVLCTSVNEEVVHCPPTTRALQAGDLVSIDAGVIVDGMYSDCAVTVPVGDVSDAAKQLISVTRTALYDIARSVIKPGNTIGDIGHAVQAYVESHGFSVVRQLVGHGIGRHLHEEPSIPNYGKPHTGLVLKPGMAIAVEPMVNIGGADVTFQDDGWRVVTSDSSLSAHFEHTFLITEAGCEVLTEL